MAGHAKTLNPRQQAFVLGVIAGLPYVDAARKAGYKATSYNLTSYASKIAKVPIVAKAIAEGRARALAITELTADRWRAALNDRYEQAAAGGRVGDQANALRALELWGRHLGLLEPRGDADAAERTRRLTENLAQLMGLQMVAQAGISVPVRAVEGEVREILALAPSSEDAPAHEGAADPADGDGNRSRGARQA